MTIKAQIGQHRPVRFRPTRGRPVLCEGCKHTESRHYIEPTDGGGYTMPCSLCACKAFVDKEPEPDSTKAASQRPSA